MYTLIIVDDEPVVREGLALHFPWEKYGFKVQEVFVGPQKALAWFERNTADVLLTDIRMPAMSGLELIQRIKENPRNRTIMCLLSAYRDFSYAREGMALGVKYYLVKPTSFEEIGETFRKIRQELEKRLPEAEAIPETDNIIVKQVYAIMRTKTASCSLFSIAGELGLAPSYLSRLFKKEMGENFRDSLRRIKMEEAAEMLTGPVNYKNRDISDALGYQDTQNFCRTFQKYYGVSPGGYRRRRLSEKPADTGLCLS
jgi:YesN/AraC family two-component response regulator